MKIKVKKLHPEAKLPTYGTEFSAGADLYSADGLVLGPGETKMIRTGLILEPEEFCDIQVRSRSGLAAKYGIHVLNAPGTIDFDFRGEVKVILHNAGKDFVDINVNDRIAQLVVHPQLRPEFVEVDQVNETSRGSGGFGSTGR